MSAFSSPSSESKAIILSESEKSEYEALAMSGAKAIQEKLLITTWTLDYSREELNLQVFYNLSEASSIRCFKAVCIIPEYTNQQVISVLSDHEARVAWESNINALSTIEVKSSPGLNICILRCATNAVGPISGRDFYDATATMQLPDGSFINGGAGIAGTDKFPAIKNFVRGYNYPGKCSVYANIADLFSSRFVDFAIAFAYFIGSGWHFQDLAEGGTKISYFIQCDLKGWFLPVVINNSVGGSYTTFFKDLKTALAAKFKK